MGKFCGDCGHRLEVETPIEERPNPSAESERKHVTILFSDLSGYTAMSEKLDSEEVKEIMGRIFGEISKIIVRYEGFIEKFMGDSVLALFGVPVAHEDDPVRAIKAAREIHEMVVSLNPLYAKKIGKPLAMHTGINTGLILTGSLDMDKNIQGVLGHSINVASRLLNLARPGDIVVGPDTFNRAEGYFNFERLDPTFSKRKTEPIKSYKVISPKEDPTKTYRISGMRAQLIGRKAEMAQLHEAVTNLKQGKGSIFSIVGDAGTGKSRLIEEIRATLSSQDIQWLEGHCYAHSQNVPYFPLIDFLSRVWQIKDGDSSEKVKEKIESGIKYLLGNKEGVIPYIGTLYSLSYPEIEGIGPELWKSRFHAGVQSIFSALIRKGPTVICLEDIHWSDTSSIELLRFILKDFQLPAVFICAHRPRFSLFTSHQLTGLSKVYQEIKLQDLSTSETQTMVESLLKTEAVPTDLKKFIQTKIEGNPFYLEEAINSLIESETLIWDNGNWKLTKQISEAVISHSVQGIITARLDRLERKTRRILQEASVIGRAFFYEILTRITDLKDVVDKSLNGLERIDFIRVKALQPDLEYNFKHALTQEVVYNGILKKERQALHERIGQVIEQLFHDRLTEFYETLAYHYKQGQSLLKAVDYLIKAGEKSFKRYALDESHSYFKEAFDLLSDKPDKTKEDEKRLIDLIIKWGNTLHYRADYMGLINLLRAHETLMESHADREQLVMFYSRFGLAFSRSNVLVEGYRYLNKALQIAVEIGDIKGVGYSCMWLIPVCADMGLIDEAIIYGERARKAARCFELDQDLSGMVLFYSAYAYWIMGDVKKTAEYGEVGLDYGRKHSDLRCIALHYNAMGMSCSSAGDFPSAIDFYKKSIKVSTDPVISHGARTLLGLCYLTTGQLKDAQSALEEVLGYSEKFGYEWVGTASQLMKGVLLITHGDLKQGVSLCENAIRLYLENRSLWGYANGNYLMGRVYAKIAEGRGEKKDFSFLMKNIGFLIKTLPFAHKKAEEHLHIAIKTAEEIGAKSLFGQAYLELGKLHKTKGKKEKARDCITNAIEAFEECEADVFLKQAREALAALG